LNAVKAEIKELTKLKQAEVLELYTTEELRSLKRSVTTLTVSTLFDHGLFVLLRVTLHLFSLLRSLNDFIKLKN